MNFSLNRSFVLILLIQYIAHYRVSKVIRKHRKLNHNHPNCFTNDTLKTSNHQCYDMQIKQTVHLPMKLCDQEGIWKKQLYTDSPSPKATITRCGLSPRFFSINAMLLCEFESDMI